MSAASQLVNEPHWRDWAWTAVERGANGGNIIKAEFDVTKPDELADRVGKIIGSKGGDERAISRAQDELASQGTDKSRKDTVTKLLAGKGVEILFVEQSQPATAATMTTSGQ